MMKLTQRWRDKTISKYGFGNWRTTFVFWLTKMI